MKRVITSLVVALFLASVASFALAADNKAKPGPVTGTWECTSHGSEQGDMPFTLTLEQNKEEVTGSVSSPMGGTEITSATYKNKTLEIHIDTPQGNYLLKGTIKKDQITGEWSIADTTQKGSFEGKKQAEAAASK